MKRSLRILSLTAALLLLAGAAQARAVNQQSATLGGNGTAYILKEGRYIEMFPGGDEAMAGARVLALDVVQPGGETVRVLVPGTEQTGAELSGVLTYEDSADTLYVLWRGWTGSDHMIKLARYADGAWSEPLDLSETMETAKGAPQLLVTRDTGSAYGDVQEAERTILHVVWWEQAWYGAVETFYRPLIVSAGGREVLGPTVALNRFLRETEVGAPVAGSLTRRPAVVAGEGGDSVVVSFADDVTGTLASFELRILPVALSALRDDVHELILRNGRQVPLDVLGDIIRAHITIGGYRLNARDLAYLGETVRQEILTVGRRENPEALADIIRAHITIGGQRMVLERDMETAPMLDQHVVEIAGDDPELRPHLVSITGLQETSVPAIPLDAEAWVFPSPDGCRMTLAWAANGENTLAYQAADPQGWGTAQTVTLTEDLTLEDGLELVHRRASQN